MPNASLFATHSGSQTRQSWEGGWHSGAPLQPVPLPPSASFCLQEEVTGPSEHSWSCGETTSTMEANFHGNSFTIGVIGHALERSFLVAVGRRGAARVATPSPVPGASAPLASPQVHHCSPKEWALIDTSHFWLEAFWLHQPVTCSPLNSNLLCFDSCAVLRVQLWGCGGGAILKKACGIGCLGCLSSKMGRRAINILK